MTPVARLVARLVALPAAGAAVAGLAVVLAGCAARAPAPVASRAGSPGVREARPGVRAAPLAPGVKAFCRGRARAGLAAALSSTVPGSRREELVPLGVAADGRTGFVSAWTPAFSGVAALSLRTGRLRPIMPFANPSVDQADGAWGGRWLVWDQTHSLQNLDRFTIYSWDSVSGRVTRLGHSLDSPAGTAWPSPWHAPAVSGRYAAWAQGYGPAGLVQIRLADLRTGRVTVVAGGHVQAPFFDGGLVVWPRSDRPGALTTLHAYSLATHRPAPLPEALRAVAGTDEVATDGTRTAYLNTSLTGLYYSPAPDERARLMLRLPTGTEFSALSMGRRTLAWTTTSATFVASTATGRYVQVTPAYGLAVTGPGPAVLIADAPSARSSHPSLPLHVLTAPAATPPNECGRARHRQPRQALPPHPRQ